MHHGGKGRVSITIKVPLVRHGSTLEVKVAGRK